MITAVPRVAIAVHDFEKAVTTFRDGFGMPLVDFSEETVPTLGAQIALCVPVGGSNIELMAPSDASKPLSQALDRFIGRRGEGPYAVMLEAPDPDVEAVAIAERGLDVLPLMEGAGGRDVHPRSTHGVLIRVYPCDSVGTPVEKSLDPGLSGVVKVIVATADAALAADDYGQGFGLDVGPPVYDEERGVICASCRAPKGGAIELVSAVAPDRPFAQRIQRCLQEGHRGIYALVLNATDPPAALASLSDRGLASPNPANRQIVTFGTRFLIEVAD